MGRGGSSPSVRTTPFSEKRPSAPANGVLRGSFCFGGTCRFAWTRVISHRIGGRPHVGPVAFETRCPSCATGIPSASPKSLQSRAVKKTSVEHKRGPSFTAPHGSALLHVEARIKALVVLSDPPFSVRTGPHGVEARGRSSITQKIHDALLDYFPVASLKPNLYFKDCSFRTNLGFCHDCQVEAVLPLRLRGEARPSASLARGVVLSKGPPPRRERVRTQDGRTAPSFPLAARLLRSR